MQKYNKRGKYFKNKQEKNCLKRFFKLNKLIKIEIYGKIILKNN